MYGKQMDAMMLGFGEAERKQHGMNKAKRRSLEKETDNCSEEDKWGGREEERVGCGENGGREGGVDAVPCLAWQGAGRLLLSCNCICDYASGSPAVRLQVLRIRRTELYLEILVINEAGAAVCTEEVDEK